MVIEDGGRLAKRKQDLRSRKVGAGRGVRAIERRQVAQLHPTGAVCKVGAGRG
ncbi:MAG: hypothetical protein KatS3mg055_3303 [Chloroflexus sp.]|nr:MAG: hypothetical protein KatS3mg055_3303 [Chloroflexus sp.]